MKTLSLSTEEFASRRRKIQDEYAERLTGPVEEAIETRDWSGVYAIVGEMFREVWQSETEVPVDERQVTRMIEELNEALEKATSDSSVQATSLMIALATINRATIDASGYDPDGMNVVLEWVTMHDSSVREAHKDTEGQQRPVGEMFDVGGTPMPYPGWPGAPVALWINCRCVLRPTSMETSAASVWQSDAQTEYNLGEQMTDEETEIVEEPVSAQDAAPVPWHGVLAPEGVTSGDGRMFSEGSLRNRDLPLPLTWQKVSADGHNQNVTVAKIEKVQKIGNEVHASGTFLSIPESDEVIGLIADFGRYGVSIDADEAVAEYSEDEVLTFSDARISAACIVSIPAFAEAYVTLGYHPVLDAEMLEGEEEEPEELAEEVETFDRGPGWVTHPKETRRIHAYWTKPGQPGFAKIGWGSPGDFNRCRALVGEKIAANSPEDTRFLNQICAQWHHDALGIWPGEHKAALEREGEAAPSISLAASGGWCAPSEWFKDPELKKPTALSFQTDERGTRIFGHLAEWGACHLGFSGTCIEAPNSASNYAYFLLGQVETDEGPVRVGNFTIGTGHAALRLGARPAAAHYDNTGTVWADVNVGEDEFGIWFAGWVRPNVSEETLYAAKASGKLSGDWREVSRGSGELELVAALSVNLEGFLTPRPAMGIVAGGQVALVAAGIVEPEKVGKIKVGLSDEDKADIAKRFADEVFARTKRQEKIAALKEKIGG